MIDVIEIIHHRSAANDAALLATGWRGESWNGPRWGIGVNPNGHRSGCKFFKALPAPVPFEQAKMEAKAGLAAADFHGTFGCHVFFHDIDNGNLLDSWGRTLRPLTPEERIIGRSL